jgi:ribosomal protein S21
MQNKFKRRKWSKKDFILPGTGLRGLKVPPGGIEPALRMFKKQMKEAGIIQDLKDRKEYVKPTTKRRLILKDARRWNKVRPPEPNRSKAEKTLLIVPINKEEGTGS